MRRREGTVERPKNQAASALTLRLSFEATDVSIPRRQNGVSSLTLYIRGPVARGSTVALILNQCYMHNCDVGGGGLRRLVIHRKDNDWDAPATAFRLIEESEVAEELSKNGSTLESFSIEGITTPMDSICATLCQLPSITSVSIKSDAPYARSNSAEALISARNLENLLQLGRISHRISLIGAVPETEEYTSVLHKAFVDDGCRLHIFVHFQQQLQPSHFCYFLLQIMEVNQLGRLDQPPSRGTVQSLAKHVRKRSTSLDAVFLIIRENPWLCRRQNNRKKVKRGLIGKMQRMSIKLTNRT